VSTATPDAADVAAEDEHRTVTEDDLRSVDAADDAWAAAFDPASPCIPLPGWLDHAVSGVEGQTSEEQQAPTVSPAHRILDPATSHAHVDVLLAQAHLALAIADDQANQDEAHATTDREARDQTADDAGRRRREAAELDATARGWDTTAEVIWEEESA
jgi:hypothetical protein